MRSMIPSGDRFLPHTGGRIGAFVISALVMILSLPPWIAQAGMKENTEIFGQARWELARRSFSSGGMQKNEQLLDVEIKSYLGEELSVKAIVRALHESELQREELRDVDLREFYLDLSAEWYRLRLGRQQVVWGKTDGLRLLDLVNPMNLREFILDDFIDSRIPLWMARTDLYIGDDTLQFLLVPDVRFNKIPGPGDRFEPVYLKRVRAFPAVHVDEGRPPHTLSNTEIGVRYSGFAHGWDYSVNYFRHWEDSPLFFKEVLGGEDLIVMRRKRLETVGGSFSKAFGGIVFRGEAAFNMGRYFSTTAAAVPSGQVAKDEIKAAFGIDYSRGDWLISGQLFESVILGYEDGIAADEYTTLVTLLVNARFLNDTLEFKLLNIFGMNDCDNLARFFLLYGITDEWKIKGGLSLFSGPSDSFIGQFDDADRIEVELMYNF